MKTQSIRAYDSFGNPDGKKVLLTKNKVYFRRVRRRRATYITRELISVVIGNLGSIKGLIRLPATDAGKKTSFYVGPTGFVDVPFRIGCCYFTPEGTRRLLYWTRGAF